MTEANIEVFRLRSTGVVVDSDGVDLGRVGELYLNDAGDPEWVTLKTEAFSTREWFIPLGQARIDGNDIHVPYATSTVTEGPQFDAETVLTPAGEAALYEYYGLTSNTPPMVDENVLSSADPRASIQCKSATAPTLPQQPNAADR